MPGALYVFLACQSAEALAERESIKCESQWQIFFAIIRRMTISRILKEAAYTISLVINPWFVGDNDNPQDIPLWAAVAICLISFIFLGLLLIAAITYLNRVI